MRTTYILRSSRAYSCTVTATVIFATCAFAIHSEAQGVSPPARKQHIEHGAAADGRKTFESVCSSCHGLDGRGGERGPNIATRLESQRLTDEELLHILQTGVPAAGMPAFGSLGVAKVRAVMGYVRILQGGNKVASISGDAQRGKSLFVGKAGCANCHMINGVGGFLGPDLTSYASKASLEEIRGAITDPNKDLEPQARTVLVTTREGKQFTGIARNEDNFSLQLQSLDGTFHLLLKSDLEHLEYQPKSLMPSDYGSVLSRAELDDLMSYLLRVARAAKQPQAAGKESRRDEEDE
jgi:cytochrome c oxidase cbb3-type subunit III